MSEYIGLIGYPLKHSISPYFQQGALDYYGLDICYEAWETSPAGLKSIVNSLRKPQNVGANVTVPYKETVLPLLDDIDGVAASIGAVNTIVKKRGDLVGFNTDAYGFLEALEKQGGLDPEGKRVVILGAGGVARAIGFSLVQRKAMSLSITDGIFERAEALAGSLYKYAGESSAGPGSVRPSIRAFRWENLNAPRTLASCDLIVHCTTIGMKDSPQEGRSALSLESIPGGVLVYDVVYNPSPTPLLALADRAGARVLGGLPMLVYQGAASFKLWTGREAPIDIMFHRANEILSGGL